jgi:23S rRNA (adenine2503-C2)-methyltransferase
MNIPVCGMTYDELYDLTAQNGFQHAHITKILIGIYRKGFTQFSQIPDIPKALKEHLHTGYSTGIYSPLKSDSSIDGSVKFLFRNARGMEFETVYLPDNRRKTVCVSTQSGCRMGCPFCLTGRYGFRGNLSAGDMINQVISLPVAKDITHVVFMGMGEPMDNLPEVLKACKIFTSEWGLSISSRNITVSTVGILPGILEFLNKSECNLTLSLHSPFPEERRVVVPVENKFPATRIIDLMRSFPPVKKRRMSVAYVMIKDINDSDRHLEALKRLLADSPIRVNLLPYHRVPDDRNGPSTGERMQYFRHNLMMAGISASIRRSRGEDISAACGLLASGLRKN